MSIHCASSPRPCGRRIANVLARRSGARPHSDLGLSVRSIATTYICDVRRTVLALALVATPLFADDVHLRGGGRLTGQVIEKTADSVIVDIGAGHMTVPASTVVRIDKSASPLQEFRERAATTAGNDADAWRALGRWANDHGLAVQADEAYRHVHDLIPADPEANRALGLILFNGAWVT